MSSHRVPLANNINAVNSPRRATLASKRGRLDNEDNVSPPKKRQNTGTVAASFRRAQKISVNEPEGKVFAERRDNAPRSQFHRKLLATQDGRQPFSQVRPESKPAAQAGPNKEEIQNWRKHYRRVFPAFVFYFDGLPPEVALKSKRMLLGLGARHEQFFSKDVTHVVTTRPIPQEALSRDPKATIDPSVLSKASERRGGASQQPRRVPATQEQPNRPVLDPRQTQHTNDILRKARELGIKVWALEKFERMMQAMFNTETAEDPEASARAGGAAAAKLVPLKRERETDELSQLLRNEKKNAAVERRPWQEIVPFKGIFIYIHDMDEEVKPVMVREYAIPARNEAGEWPMLRSVSKGRCPFVEEPPQERRAEQLRAARREQAAQAAAAQAAPRLTRAHTAPSATQSAHRLARTRSQTRSPEKNVLHEMVDNAQNQSVKPSASTAPSKGFEPPTLSRPGSGSTENMPPLLGSTHANWKGIPRNPGGEPMASGLQGMNITSAIRSQMYSSTAPSAPGARVGMSKQQHQMSRKVLERQSGLSGNSVPSSLNANDVRAAINNEHSAVPRRSTRQKAADTMEQIYEDDEGTEDEGRQQQAKQQAAKKKAVKREPKPGYCENCKDKYADFQEHITSKKHKRFAQTDEHWTELDELLKELVRV